MQLIKYFFIIDLIFYYSPNEPKPIPNSSQNLTKFSPISQSIP